MSDCRHLKPKICGNKLKPFLSDKGCGVPRFVGIEDVTINQGIGIDLTEGVYAYDGNGNEIPYTVTPDSIDMCDVGEHTVIYRAMAEGKKFAPWFCSKQRGLAGDLLCNRVALRKDRTVTIEQIDPPRIEGLDTVKISPNVEFDPTEGVTAIDGNGNEIEYTYSGPVDAVAEGAIASFETEFEQNAKSVLVNIEPIQSGSGTPSPDNVCPISGHTECVTSRCGKNLFDPTIYDGGVYNPAVGSVWNLTESATQFTQDGDTYSLTTSATWRYYTLLFEIPNTAQNYWRSLTFTSSATGGTTESYLDENFTVLWKSNSTDVTQVKSALLAIPSGAKYYALVITNRSTASATLSLKAPQIELGSTATDYEPYNGTTHTTDLGRTVYGGILDVVSGELVVDRIAFNPTSVGNVAKHNSGIWYSVISIATNPSLSNNEGYIISDMFKKGYLTGGVGSCYITNSGRSLVVILPQDITTVESADAWMTENAPTFVYELATPQTYFLTRQEIALLEGQNNVWSDSGDVRVVYQESMPIGESIEYDTVGERIITYTATDICGNTSEVEREILVGITAQACKSQACGAFVYCAPTEACEAIVGLSATACE